MRDGDIAETTSAFVVLSVVLLGTVFLGGLKALNPQFDAAVSQRVQMGPNRMYPESSARAIVPQSTVYLPLVQVTHEVETLSIWPHAEEPAPHEVALFRHTFDLDAPVTEVQLAIFADTRYEVWVDGTWVGRGPARFSHDLKEYDTYSLPPLHPGTHLIAVLVQWAPNTRRSESDVPMLRAYVDGISEDGEGRIVRTGPHWKATLSSAWRKRAADVHKWKLIGPTELLDLRRLPDGWTTLSFSDADWSAAAVQNVPDSAYAARTISKTQTVSMPVAVQEVGYVSPSAHLFEITPSLSTLEAFSLTTVAPTTAQLEFVTASGTASAVAVSVDGRHYSEQPIAGDRPPGIYRITAPLDAGSHTVTVENVPSDGLTMAISGDYIQTEKLPPLRQGFHAGRRLLLAEYARADSPVHVVTSSMTATLTITDTPAYAILDLGRTVHGRVRAQVDGPAGSLVDIGWDERLWNNRRPLPFPGPLHDNLWNQTDSWILDGQPRTMSTIDARAGRYVLIAAWGDTPIQIDNLRVLEERYPVTRRGLFTSTNPTLNRIWQVGVDSLYPNMNDGYTDTPWRERGQWWGDAYVEYKINSVAFADTQLLRRGLVLMAEAFSDGRPTAMAPNGQDVHMLDYGMLWVQGLQDYLQDSGNAHFLRQTYPTVRTFIDYLAGYEDESSGLLDLSKSHWSQTALVDWAGTTSRFGESAAVNAMYYGTLLDAARIAEAVGDGEQAAVWRNKAGVLKEQINAVLYRPESQLYVATIYDNTVLAPSPHAQAWTLAYDVVPVQDKQHVADSLMELLSDDPGHPNVEMYGMFWVLKALGRANRVWDGIRVIERYYGRLLELGATTWWEHFTSNEDYRSSLSHGWGGSPTWFLTTYVLGARATSPTSWRVTPALRGVQYAAGTLPLAHGELNITWERKNCEEASLSINAPTETTGEVILDLPTDKTSVWLDELSVWDEGDAAAQDVYADESGIRVQLDGGAHTLRTAQACYQSYLPLAITPNAPTTQ